MRERVPLMLLAFAAQVVAAQPAVPVTATRAEMDQLAVEVTVTGSVTSPRVGSLSTSVGGLVARVASEEGDRVRAGDVLLELDTELQSIALDSAKAAQAEAVAELDDARRRLAEAQRLAERRGISESEVRSLEAGVAIRQAVADRLGAQAREQEVLLVRHRVSAPFAGVVSRKLTEVGAWVQPGTPVVELVATEGLRVDLQVPQQYYTQIVSGEVVLAVTLDTAPERAWRARTLAIVPVGDPGVRTFLMRTAVIEPGVQMAPGMSARARLSFGSGERGVVIPRDALMRYADGRITVWVIDRSGDLDVVSERPVTVGVAFAGRVEIREGLAAGTWVVLRGNEALREGQHVSVRAAAGAADSVGS